MSGRAILPGLDCRFSSRSSLRRSTRDSHENFLDIPDCSLSLINGWRHWARIGSPILTGEITNRSFRQGIIPCWNELAK